MGHDSFTKPPSQTVGGFLRLKILPTSGTKPQQMGQNPNKWDESVCNVLIANNKNVLLGLIKFITQKTERRNPLLCLFFKIT